MPNLNTRLLQLNPQIILTGQGAEGKGVDAHLQYLQHIRRTQPAPSVYEQQTAGYDDYIEIPLQVGAVVAAFDGTSHTARRIVCAPTHCLLRSR